MSDSEARTSLEPAAVPHNPSAFDDDEPPSSPRRHPAWQDVPQDKWDDWRWQMQNAIRSVRQLRTLLSFSDDELEAVGRLEADYKVVIPPYYFSLIDPANPADPIRLQSVPDPRELGNQSGYELEDPLEEDKDSPVPGVTHRYPDRALLVTTPACSMYCRFCTRKRATLTRGGWESVTHDDRKMVEYVAKHPEIRDVIVSGGDPLTLPTAKLKFFLDGLSRIKHVDVIRLGTRVPVTLPQRLYDKDLLKLLRSAKKVWIQTHFNHPREITPEAKKVCNALLKAGMPVNNHTVLLKGVNDNLETMRKLMRGLLRIKVRPYYLFHCDPVTGAGHFRTSVWRGIEIMEGLRGHMSGLGIPTYVVDSPHGGGKIPVMPNYLISAGEDAVILRNFEGQIVRYQAEDRPITTETTVTRGVSSLLQGTRSVIAPEGSERLARRKARAPGCGGPSHPEVTDEAAAELVSLGIRNGRREALTD